MHETHEWAEVEFIPTDASRQRGLMPDRYLVIRARPLQGDLFADRARHHYFATVTNRWDWDGERLVTGHEKVPPVGMKSTPLTAVHTDEEGTMEEREILSEGVPRILDQGGTPMLSEEEWGAGRSLAGRGMGTKAIARPERTLPPFRHPPPLASTPKIP